MGQGTFILISKFLKVIKVENSQTGQFIVKYDRNMGHNIFYTNLQWEGGHMAPVINFIFAPP